MNQWCRATKRDSLPPEVALLPAGGSGEKMMPFAAFLAGGQMNGVLLVDSDRAGRSTAKLAKDRFDDFVHVVFTRTDARGLEETIEDLVDRQYYIGLANETLAARPDATQVDGSGLGDGPVVAAITAAFAHSGTGNFQKLKAALVAQGRAELGENPPPDGTLDTFGELFGRLCAAITVAE
jgi:hypothetical protein